MGALGDVAVRDRTDHTERDTSVRPVDDLVVGAARAELLERLSAGLVHEARNPLNAMAIHLEVLADKLRDDESGELPPQYARNLDAARNQVRRLDDLLRRWGEFSCERTEAEELAVSAARAASLCEYHLRRAGLELAIDVPAGLVVDRAGLVCQALTELLLLCARRAAPGSRLHLTGSSREGDISVAIRGSTVEEPEATAAGDTLAVDAVRAIARKVGGALASTGGASGAWTLRLPRAAAPHSAIL